MPKIVRGWLRGTSRQCASAPPPPARRLWARTLMCCWSHQPFAVFQGTSDSDDMETPLRALENYPGVTIGAINGYAGALCPGCACAAGT